MKNSEEMARDVLNRISQYEQNKKLKMQKIIKNVQTISCVFLIVVVAFVITNAFVYGATDKHIWEHIIDLDERNVVKESFETVKSTFQSDIKKLKDGEYKNLRYISFEASIDEVTEVNNIEILSDNSYKDKSFSENAEKMNQVIDKFFMEEFDKSYIVADSSFLFGNKTADGGYMVQISESLNHAWFSRYGLGDIGPFDDFEKVYPYISGIRQVEDVEINLQDGSIMLSEMEEQVLEYINCDAFPLPVSENIDFAIGEVRIIENGQYDGVSFKVRRIYKGIPFEYGSVVYDDCVDKDYGEIDYTDSAYPDTMLTFGRVNGEVVETESITEMITLGTALELLSEGIGDSAVYDVYGVELVYRNDMIPDERKEEVDDILVPKWKIITAKKDGEEYKIYYVDIVTGKISSRYEYKHK